jgi:hypothetical protein
MKPPGKPFDEIVTLSPARNIWITSIKSSDGTVLYQRPAYNSFTARMAGRLSIGVHPGTICQLPAGTYTIGAQYFAVSASKSSYSMADQYITADFQNGRKYILSYKIIEREKWSESDKWKLKLLEE